MATFFSNQTIWYWGSTAYPVRGTLTGNVSRSGNTVTLSGMSLSLSWPSSAYGTYSVSFTVNGTTTTRSIAANTGSFAVNNTSFSVGATATSKSVSWSSSDGYSGSFTVTFPSGATSPTAGDTTLNSRTWNSVNLTGRVSSWGTYSGSNQAFCIGVLGSSATSWSGGRNESVNENPGTTTSRTATINNSSTKTDGGINIRGGLAFKIGTYCRNGSGLENAKVMSTVYYLPPSPLTAGTATVGALSNDKYPVTLAATGGSSTNNNSVTVTTYYRIKKSTDSSYGSWTSMGTGTPWTQKTATIQADPSTSYNVQFKQTYQSQDSQTYTTGFTTPGLPFTPTAYGSVDGASEKIERLYGPVNGQSKRIRKLYASVNGQSKLIYED